MDDYKLPEKTLPMRAIIKASSAVGIFFVCPVCNKELLFSDERLASDLRDCPLCHTALVVPHGEERTYLIKRATGAFIP